MDEPRECELPLTAIREPSDRHRTSMDPERLGELADDIAAQGLINAIGVRGPDAAGLYEVVHGHRRFLAHQLLRRPTIRARVYPLDVDALDVRAAENLQRADLNPLEEAHVVRRYVERGEALAAIARRLRRSSAWVGQRLALLDLPADVQAAVSGGVVKLGVALALGGIDHDDYRRELLAEAQRTGATVQTANVWLAHYAADRARLVANHATVAEILERREAWKYYVPCDGCARDHEYSTTRALRFCPDCLGVLAEALGQRPVTISK